MAAGERNGFISYSSIVKQLSMKLQGFSLLVSMLLLVNIQAFDSLGVGIFTLEEGHW